MEDLEFLPGTLRMKLNYPGWFPSPLQVTRSFTARGNPLTSMLLDSGRKLETETDTVRTCKIPQRQKFELRIEAARHQCYPLCHRAAMDPP